MHLPSLLNNFPAVSYGFAYGSGVFHQAGLYDSTGQGAEWPPGPMVDMILVVEDPVQWHTQVRLQCIPPGNSPGSRQATLVMRWPPAHPRSPPLPAAEHPAQSAALLIHGLPRSALGEPSRQQHHAD